MTDDPQDIFVLPHAGLVQVVHRDERELLHVRVRIDKRGVYSALARATGAMVERLRAREELDAYFAGVG